MQKHFLSPTEKDNLGLIRLQWVFDIIQKAGGQVRIVGGAVRDVMLGLTPKEIDFATTMPPQTIMDIMKAQGIKTVPTGIDHGTVMIVRDGVGYEITSLRKDVETDGRHAKIAFTDDWAVDAMRRDFTINAMSVDYHGNVYDYTNGMDDIRAGRVVFIGDAKMRIAEDYLRILRFFRFYAYFGLNEIDAVGFQACKDAVAKINTLSAERVGREILKTLSAPDPCNAWERMIDAGIPQALGISIIDTMTLEKLIKLEDTYGVFQNPLRRLAALFGAHSPATHEIENMFLKLRLSNAERKYIQEILPLSTALGAGAMPVRAILYKHKANADMAVSALLISGARGARIGREVARDDMMLCQKWGRPIFPLSGTDIKKLGVAEGMELGRILNETEAWWCDEGFHPDHAACLDYAKGVL